MNVVHPQAAPSGHDTFEPRLRATTGALLRGVPGRGGSMWWFVPTAALVGLALVRPTWLTSVEVSLWQFVLWAVPVNSAVQAIVTVATQLPLYVAGGVDRRTFLRAALLHHLVHVAIAVVLGVAGFAVERAALVPAGLEPGLVQGNLYAATDQHALVAIQLALLMSAAWWVGWLVALAYYRAGWWRGTLGALLAVGPPILVLGLLDAGGPSDGQPVVPVLGAFAAIAVAGVVADRLTATTELRGTSTWMRAG